WADDEDSEGDSSPSKPTTLEASKKKHRSQTLLPTFSDTIQIDPIMGRKKKQKKQKKKAPAKVAVPTERNENLADELPERSLGDVAVWKEGKPNKKEAQKVGEGWSTLINDGYYDT